MVHGGVLSPYRRGRLGRTLQLVGHHLTLALAWTVAHIARPNEAPSAAALPSVVRFVPHRPTTFVRRLRSPARAWTETVPAPPPELLTVAGIRRDPELEVQAYEKAPLREFFGAHFEEIAPLAPVLTMIAPVLAVAPRLTAATTRLLRRQDIEPTATARTTDADR